MSIDESKVLIRRCAVLVFEPQETVEFDLQELVGGGDGLRRTLRWQALAPHLGEPVAVDARQRELLGRISPSAWTALDSLGEERGTAQALLDSGLLVARAPGLHDAHRERDERLRQGYWHPLGAVLHAFTRWDGVDAVRNMHESGTETASKMRQVLGEPPAEARRLVTADDELIRLPEVPHSDFDALMHRRVTCRNFDASRPVPLPVFAKVIERALAAQAKVEVTGDLVFLKKNVPSGGGLHPMEAYLVVQNVEGLAPGLYHYRADVHALEALPAPEGGLPEFVMEAVAQQHWFGDAHVLVALAPRFDRTFWKYRHHAKGYRVVALEAGHVSQTLYLAATDLGLGAFITGAINEKHLERALGLDPVTQGVVAICGFGWRASQMTVAELDPACRIWA
ncbi:putative peptide maturation dehydrogenase [Stenotrophomonas sp. Marseille-Q4652]|uniref:putative peptide maturation dehydrogenase n=1 Tax=Stenotrophomonas sp. Marseille-Q4652 TaxID=2866595 RepID=UPI001CE4380B|nr:putative peptide maturation dehydrogenase [Stenotrophomonas sp. Marseille-Q4652]